MERCYLAGDDDQAIYHFKGATPDAFLFPELPATQKILLSQSYRLPEVIHAQAMEWVQDIEPREPKPYYPRKAEGRIEYLPHDFQSPELFYHRLQEDLATHSSVMVIGSCRYMLDPLITLLREIGIPFHNPYRPNEGRWNPLRVSDSHTTAQTRVLAFHRLHQSLHDQLDHPYTYRDLWAWAQEVRAVVWKRGAKKAMETHAAECGEVPMEKQKFLDWVDSASVIHALRDGDPEWLLSVGTQKGQCQLAFAVHVAQRQGMQALESRPKLTIGTIHSVKGGQADCVYLFPDMSTRADEEWWSSEEGKMAMKRVFYVGMTRAKEKLVFCEPASDRHMWN